MSDLDAKTVSFLRPAIIYSYTRWQWKMMEHVIILMGRMISILDKNRMLLQFACKTSGTQHVIRKEGYVPSNMNWLILVAHCFSYISELLPQKYCGPMLSYG